MYELELPAVVLAISTSAPPQLANVAFKIKYACSNQVCSDASYPLNFA